MANDVTLGSDGSLFIGEDKTIRFEVVDLSDVPVDLSGWTILFDVRTKDDAADPAIIAVDATVSGTYDATRADNTQRALVVLSDDDLAATKFKGSNLPVNPKTYRYSLKRMDAGQETVLVRGDFSPEKATAP